MPPIDLVDDAGPEPGWYPDPRSESARQRWWAGSSWAVRVRIPGQDEGISWTPDLAEMVPPTPVPTPAVDAPEPIVVPITGLVNGPIVTGGPRSARSPDLAPEVDGLDPLVAAFGAEARSEPDDVPTPSRLGRRVAAMVLVAALGAVATGSSAAVINQSRPRVATATTYTDAAAGFTLQYPEGWHIQTKVPDSTIRFAIGARGATPTETNTVSVLVSSKPTPLPGLDTLASQVPGGLRGQFPGIRLERARRTTLLGGPAFSLNLTVSDEVPPIRIEQYVGTTTAGRTLTITVTVREPRTAPSPALLSDFLRSIESA